MPREKGTSEGTIYFNKQRKKWNAQFIEYDSITGQLSKKTKSFNSEEEAKKFLQTIMYQKESKIYIENNGIPLMELMKANLQIKYDTNLISNSQYDRVERTLKKLGQSYIAHKNIDDITPEEIQGYLNTLKHLSNSSINKIFQQFNQAFRYANNKGYLMRNPMINVIKPKSLKKDKIVRALTVEEQQKFTEWLLNQRVEDFPYKTVYLIQMYMGLRIGETLALKNTDIDFRNQKAHISRTLTKDVKGNVIMGETTKTYAGTRIVPIPQHIYLYVLEQMKIGEKNNDRLLFKPPINTYVDRENVNQMLKKVLKPLGIEGITTHSLRHTFGTRCIEAGMAPVVVQRLLGHTDVSVTLNTYTSVFDQFKENEISKVNQYYMQQNLISNNHKQLSSEEEIER